MSYDKHEEFIVFKDGLTMFITGVKDTCDHEYDDEVMYTKSGKTIIKDTYPLYIPS